MRCSAIVRKKLQRSAGVTIANIISVWTLCTVLTFFNTIYVNQMVGSSAIIPVHLIALWPRNRSYFCFKQCIRFCCTFAISEIENNDNRIKKTHYSYLKKRKNKMEKIPLIWTLWISSKKKGKSVQVTRLTKLMKNILMCFSSQFIAKSVENMVSLNK